MTKKFKVTIEKEFEVPGNATDQEYDDMKAVVLAGIKDDEKTKVKIELVDGPDEVKEKYIINKDCD